MSHPPRMPGDWERALWDSSSDFFSGLEGKIVTEAELKDTFSKYDSQYGIKVVLEVSDTGWCKGYKILGFEKQRFRHRLAYECGSCRQIVIGPPRIEDEDSIGEIRLAGRKGYYLYCHNCDARLEENIEVMS